MMLIALIGGLNSAVLSIAASRSSSAETLPELTSSAWPRPSINRVCCASGESAMNSHYIYVSKRAKASIVMAQ